MYSAKSATVLAGIAGGVIGIGSTLAADPACGPICSHSSGFLEQRLTAGGSVLGRIAALNRIAESDATMTGAEGIIFTAVNKAAAWSVDPLASRTALIQSIEHSGRCYTERMTPKQAERDLPLYGMRNPALGPLNVENPEYFTSGTVWRGDVNPGQNATGSSAQGRRATLTYSFPADGPTWGSATSGFTPAPNELNARFDALFTADDRDRGHELLRQALASWRKYGGITYTQVADDNAAYNTSATKSATRGDIRIGGHSFNVATSVLAYNQFPSSGGDMNINVDYFTGAFNGSTSLGGSNNNYRYLRNVASHEHGHGLGYNHVVGCNLTKLMEPQASTSFDMVQIDERRGAGRNYGDHNSGNGTNAAAKDYGDLTSPVLKSIIEKDASTNGSSGPNNSNQDWYKFSLSSAQDVTITVTPTGGTYNNDPQTSGCTAPATPTSIVATQAGNLNVILWNANGTSQIISAAAGGAGSTETIAANLAAGSYSVQVIDVGPNANQVVQLYDMTIRVADSKAPPQAIAGLNKRIAAGARCWFMGNINSRVLETGASITRYDWDLDGNGTYETLNQSQPVKIYTANGVYNVGLKVTDSNGMTDTDTIQVTVFGATTTVSLVSPTSGNQGATLHNVAILATNVKSVTSASQIIVSGTGVTVSGTPVPDAMGTRIDGLTFTIAPDAPVGPRTITLLNTDGQGTNGFGVDKFTVNPAPSGSCQPADIADDAGNPLPSTGSNGGVNEGDYNLFFQGFFEAAPYCNIADDAGIAPPVGSNNGVNEGDYNAFFQLFFLGCP